MCIHNVNYLCLSVERSRMQIARSSYLSAQLKMQAVNN